MTINGTLKRLCGNIAAGRFNWWKYCSPQPYFGYEICVTPLHCSYGQIGYTVHFPYTNMPEVEYDWVLKKLTIDGEKWKNYLHNQYGTEFLYQMAGRNQYCDLSDLQSMIDYLLNQ